MRKIRNFVNLLLIFIIVFSSASVRAEESNFDTFPLTVVLNGKTFSGLLLSDLEYDRYTRLDIEYNNILEKYNVILNYQTFVNEKLGDLKSQISDSFLEIQKNAYIETTWWDNNKDWIFITSGIIVGFAGAYLILDK